MGGGCGGAGTDRGDAFRSLREWRSSLCEDINVIRKRICIGGGCRWVLYHRKPFPILGNPNLLHHSGKDGRICQAAISRSSSAASRSLSELRGSAKGVLIWRGTHADGHLNRSGLLELSLLELGWSPADFPHRQSNGVRVWLALLLVLQTGHFRREQLSHCLVL